MAEIAAVIDGRTVVPAHGSREMPVWGERFGEMGGGGSVGEEVVRGTLLVLIEYLQAIQQVTLPAQDRDGAERVREESMVLRLRIACSKGYRVALRPDGPRSFQAHSPEV